MQNQLQLGKMTRKNKNEQNELQIKSLEINNLLNKLIGYNYDSKFANKEDAANDIAKFFDLLLWCEKALPLVLLQLFQMKALEQIQQIHLARHLVTIFKGYILIMTNCKLGGIMAENLLDNKLPHMMLQAYLKRKCNESEEDQNIEYIGSYLKCYHRIFRGEWLHKFLIAPNYFQLLELTFRFFNCPQLITKTTVLALLLDILTFPQVHSFIRQNKDRQQFYVFIIDKLAKTLRNQLIYFGNKIDLLALDPSSTDKFFEIIKQIDDKISFWEDLSKACQPISQLFQIPFCKNVLLPLLIGPLKISSKPLFSIKYSMLILEKLMNILKNFDLTQVLLKIIFIEENVLYWPHQVNVAKIQPFYIASLLGCEQIAEEQQQERDSFSNGIKKFYEALFKSKDNHFILMLSLFLQSLYKYLDSAQISLQYGLQYNMKLNNQLSEKLIAQLSETHRLITIQTLFQIIISINGGKHLPGFLQQQFVMIFKNLIDQTKTILKSKSQFWDHIVEVNQYDIQRIKAIEFGKGIDRKKLEDIYKIVFTWDSKEQENELFPFYSIFPETSQDYFRYLHIKFLLFAKVRQLLIPGDNSFDIPSKYEQKFKKISPFEPGKTLKIQKLNFQLYECQIIDQKIKIPSLWLLHEEYFVLGFWEKNKKEVKVIFSIKYKHISSTDLVAKSQRIMLTLVVNSYNSKVERVKRLHTLKIRGIDSFLPKIVAFQIRTREREMIFISNFIKTTEESLPKPSLI